MFIKSKQFTSISKDRRRVYICSLMP